MDAGIAIRADRGILALRSRVSVVMIAIVAVLVLRSAASASPTSLAGAPTCRHLPNATTTQYLTGEACPPHGFRPAFGYEPVLERTPAGWRFTRPWFDDGGCSGPLADAGPFWDFGAACRAHDYGYDLVRFGVGERADADATMYRDIKATCAAQNAVSRPACKTIADSAHAVLWLGDVSPGFEPTQLAAS